MLNKLKIFIRTSVLGGLIVILPVTILGLLISWIFKLLTNLIQPLTNIVVHKAYMPELVADLIVIIIILLTFFLVGVFVKTKLGKWTFLAIEDNVLRVAPGYTLIKETVLQFIGNKKPPFSQVVLANVFNSDTLVTAFVTDTHDDGSYTVFMPTGPNPTSGMIFHLTKEQVFPISTPIEKAMKSIISCGAGSEPLIESLKKNRPLE